MKNTFGNEITYTLFGESHGPCIGITIDGLCAGLRADEEYMKKELAKRRASGLYSTARNEEDVPVILSGVKAGFTEGTPVTIVIFNRNVKSDDYAEIREKARPSHADYAAEMKYLGFQDVNGGGHFSGRLTAPIVAGASLVRKALQEKGITVGTHIKSLAGIEDRGFNDLETDLRQLNEKNFAILDEEKGEEMKKAILAAREEKDSLGAVLETGVTGLMAGIGEPVFDSMESVIAHGLFAIGGIKGVEFGDGFALSSLKGSQANDGFHVENGRVITETNHNGGINGGISNGMPIIIRSAVKPTPSIGKRQKTINYKTMENTEIEITGRHDPCIAVRARAVVDSVVVMCLAELLVQRHGCLWLRNDV